MWYSECDCKNMETVKVTIDWCNRNYFAFVGEKMGGVVIVTDPTMPTPSHAPNSNNVTK